MKKQLILDAKDYDTNLSELRRVAVRGVIFRDGKLLLVENNFGEVKLPGGGQDAEETDIDTLVREVREETGYQVIPDSAEEFCEIIERRMSVKEPMIWHQISRIYFCKIEKEQGTCEYSEGEKKYGFRQVWYTVEEAIQKNEQMLQHEGVQAWNQREYKTLQMIQEYLGEQGNEL